MKNVIKRFALLVTFFSVSLLLNACGPDMSPEYGVHSITLPNGQEVFVKRTVWGLNGDSLVISPNKDHCNTPDAKTDYDFRGEGWFGFYYKIENDILILYVWNKAIEPESSIFPIKVVQKEFSPLEYREMEKNAATLGLKHLQVEIDKSLKCK